MCISLGYKGRKTDIVPTDFTSLSAVGGQVSVNWRTCVAQFYAWFCERHHLIGLGHLWHSERTANIVKGVGIRHKNWDSKCLVISGLQTHNFNRAVTDLGSMTWILELGGVQR
jgi:hypothetical protein